MEADSDSYQYILNVPNMDLTTASLQEVTSFASIPPRNR